MTETAPEFLALVEKVLQLEETLNAAQERVNTQERRIEKLTLENKKLKEKVKELEAKLQDQSNPGSQSLSTPSSKIYPKSNRPPKGSRPRGAPKGHHGASLKIPDEVDEEIIHCPEECPNCGYIDLGAESEGWSQTSIDFIPARVQVVRHKYLRKWCPICKEKISIRSDDTLHRRNYGPNIATTSGFLENLGIPLRKIKLIFKTLFNCNISVPQIKALSNLVAQSAKPEYEKLLEEVKKASAVNADETSFRVDGINNWCWDFVWDEGIVYVIHPSRGKTVPQNVLGEDYEGCIGHDGWLAYNSVGGKHQLDYVHVNRKLAQVEVKRGVVDRGFLKPIPVRYRKRGRPPKNLNELLRFVEQLRTIMRDAVIFSERQPTPSSEEREEMHFHLLHRLAVLYAEDWSDADVVRLCKYARKDQMFTFVIHPEISWENNRAERGVRALATIRNNTGGRRSRKGADHLQCLLSVFETLKMREKDVYEEAKAMLLRAENDQFMDKFVA